MNSAFYEFKNALDDAKRNQSPSFKFRGSKYSRRLKNKGFVVYKKSRKYNKNSKAKKRSKRV